MTKFLSNDDVFDVRQHYRFVILDSLAHCHSHCDAIGFVHSVYQFDVMLAEPKLDKLNEKIKTNEMFDESGQCGGIF